MTEMNQSYKACDSGWVLRCVGVASLLLLSWAAPVPAQEPTIALTVGQPIAREMRGGEQHTYQVTLNAGQYARIAVEQKGIDVVVVLLGADGKPQLQVDNNLSGTRGMEVVLLLAEVSGPYLFNVGSLEKDASAGRYEVRIEDVRAATEADRIRVAAERSYFEKLGREWLLDRFRSRRVDFWAYHEQFDGRADEYRPFLRSVTAAVRDAGPAAAYARAQQERVALTGIWERWMAAAGIDLLLEATIPGPAPERTIGYTPELPNPDPHILLTFAWNATGFPVAALPAGLGARSGLPVGVSLIGPRGAEAEVVRAGIDLQEHALAPPAVPYATP